MSDVSATDLFPRHLNEYVTFFCAPLHQSGDEKIKFPRVDNKFHENNQFIQPWYSLKSKQIFFTLSEDWLCGWEKYQVYLHKNTVFSKIYTRRMFFVYGMSWKQFSSRENPSFTSTLEWGKSFGSAHLYV